MKTRRMIGGEDDKERMRFLYFQIDYLQEEIDEILAEREEAPVEFSEGYLDLVYPLCKRQQEYQEELDVLKCKMNCKNGDETWSI